jgi:hypothetical protein
VPHKAGHHLGQAPIGFRPRGSDDPVGEGGIVLGCLGYAAGPELHSWCWRWVGNHLAHVESRGWGEGCWLGLVRQAVQCGGCFQGGFRGRMVEGRQTSTCTCTREGNKVWTGWSHCRGNARRGGPGRTTSKFFLWRNTSFNSGGADSATQKTTLTNHQHFMSFPSRLPLAHVDILPSREPR